MENWLIFAIISVFATGFHNFTLKIAAEKHYDVSLINVCSYLFMVLILGVYILFSDYRFSFENISIIIFLAFVNVFLFSISMFTRVASMKNIDTVIFFPIYKTIGPIIVTFISLFYFNEVLTFKEVIGIIIGISIPLLLVSNAEKHRQKNLFLGFILVIITAILTAITTTASKEVMVMNYDVTLYLLLGSIFGLIMSITSYKVINKKKNINKFNIGFIYLALLSGLLYAASFFSFMYALEGNLAIVFTINSFSMLVPIILSIIFYKEHFNLLKGIVIFLSIVSILLFI